jgi:hypothetical protein
MQFVELRALADPDISRMYPGCGMSEEMAIMVLILGKEFK